MIDSKNYDSLLVTPRKSLEIPVIMVCEQKLESQLLCYFPKKDQWCKLRDTCLSCDQVV